MKITQIMVLLFICSTYKTITVQQVWYVRISILYKLWLLCIPLSTLLSKVIFIIKRYVLYLQITTIPLGHFNYRSSSITMRYMALSFFHVCLYFGVYMKEWYYGPFIHSQSRHSHLPHQQLSHWLQGDKH